MTEYRDNGAVGAMLDEYEKALNELVEVVSGISVEEITAVVDAETDDADCWSIQTILTHVVRAGYTYTVEIRKYMGERLAYPENETLPSPDAYIKAMKEMFVYCEQLFMDYPNLPIEEDVPEKKMLVRWGQRYDVEQLMEHAIVHVLRHRRQIERYLLRLRA